MVSLLQPLCKQSTTNESDKKSLKIPKG